MEQDPMQVALSTEIVMDIILSHLKVGDLLSCRLASKFWNKAASSNLRKRSTMMKNIADEEHLMKLKKLMKKNSDFPFAGLAFDKPFRLNSDRAMEFFQNYGDRFTRLCLNTCWKRRMNDLVPFIFHLSRLWILEVSAVCGCTRLLGDRDARQEDSKIVELPSVRTIRIFSSDFELNEDALCEVLLASSSPSLQIECLDCTTEILRVLDRVGKLQAVSFMKFNAVIAESEYDFEMDQLLSTESPSLTKLEFTCQGSLSWEGLDKILVSSQHTLKELRMDVLRWNILWETFPVFSKLTKLSLYVEHDNFRCRLLFRGRCGYKFPVLKDLKLRIMCRRDGNSGVSDGLFVVPSLTTIDLGGYYSEDAMKKLARSFPNVTEMRLKYEYYSGDYMPSEYGGDPFEIWNVRKFKCLEKLRIWSYSVKRRSKHYIGMDSFLTGIPLEICANLRKQNRLNLMNSPFNEVLRVNQSIVQLKNLKELVVLLKVENKLEELPEDPPFISMISVWYALDMMPNLEAKFMYKHRSPPSLDAIRAKAVLKTAFKHVLPSIKLERFSY